ncbi:MAG: hypothetical protein C0501_05850 [Isosphaera sp.]|nr:hypothetical protein [Isosphaera sp.]
MLRITSRHVGLFFAVGGVLLLVWALRSDPPAPPRLPKPVVEVVVAPVKMIGEGLAEAIGKAGDRLVAELVARSAALVIELSCSPEARVAFWAGGR